MSRNAMRRAFGSGNKGATNPTVGVVLSGTTADCAADTHWCILKTLCTAIMVAVDFPSCKFDRFPPTELLVKMMGQRFNPTLLNPRI